MSTEHRVRVQVHEASKRDVARDKDLARRRITESKISKFIVLSRVPTPDQAELERRYGPIRKHNDLIDCTLLHALAESIVDFLVTQDGDLQKRASACGLGKRVLTVEEAVEWLRNSYEPKSVSLQYVEERYCYELDKADPIFDTLRADYPAFDDWFRDACVNGQRKCWKLTVDGETAGIVIFKDESGESNTVLPAERALKLCTFKVSEKYRGDKFGEQLLKQALWWAQSNRFDVAYLTAYPRHVTLIELLEWFGFRITREADDGELQFEKPLGSGPVAEPGDDVVLLDRLHYPRFVDDARVRVLCVPIRPRYHRLLFPEVYDTVHPTLFGAIDEKRKPGNTIRKVYLCRSGIKKMGVGDVLLFYQSKDDESAQSQTMATVGVVTDWTETADIDMLLRLTAKRSAYSDGDLRAILAEKQSPLKVIDFMLTGHFDHAVPWDELKRIGVFKAPPQSIVEVERGAYAALNVHARLGF